MLVKEKRSLTGAFFFSSNYHRQLVPLRNICLLEDERTLAMRASLVTSTVDYGLAYGLVAIATNQDDVFHDWRFPIKK